MNSFHEHSPSTQRTTSFYIEDILLNKPKQAFREYASSLTVPRAPLSEYSYAYLANPAFLQHPMYTHAFAAHKPDHPFLIPTAGKCQNLSSHLAHKVPPDIVVWIANTFDNNFGIKNDFAKHLKRSSW